MHTRTRTLGELHEHLRMLGYNFMGLRKSRIDGAITVDWGEHPVDDTIQTAINNYQWTYEEESLHEIIARLQAQIDALKNGG